MKSLATRTFATLVYAVLAYVGALAVWFAEDAPFLEVAFFAWNIACATLFAHVVTRASGGSSVFVVLAVLLGPVVQVGTLGVLVDEALGRTLIAALLRIPGSLPGVLASNPMLHLAWFGVPAVAAGIVLHLQGRLSKR